MTPVFILGAALAWAARPVPAFPYALVHNEKVISYDAQEDIGHELRSFHDRTGRRFVIALFQGLEGEDPGGYSRRVFRDWKIGLAERGDGILFCFFKKEGVWRLELGEGLAPLVDAREADAEVRSLAGPAFASGDLDTAVRLVVTGLSGALEAREAERSRADRPGTALRPRLPDGAAALVLLGAAALLALFVRVRLR